MRLQATRRNGEERKTIELKKLVRMIGCGDDGKGGERGRGNMM